jgi:hypothetical protein
MGAPLPRHARQRGRHRRRTPEKRHIAASVALVGASVITGASAAPPPPPPPELSVASAEVRLAAASSLLNVPVNLLIDLINIPHNEVRALDYSARAFLFSGPWFVVGPTNVWGVDAGDPPKFMSVVNMLVPFPALSGIDLGEFDQTGLGQQSWFFVATQLPTSQYCDDEGCRPTVPTAPITGIAVIDSTIWSFAILTGQVKFPLFDNWFKVPISDLTSGYTFGPDYPGRVNPAGPIYPGLGFAGTTVDPVTGEHVVPWDGMTFTLDPSKPFANYFDHLMADPSTNPIQLPDLEQFGRALQSLAAAMVVAFYPFTPGSFFCPGDCSYLPPALDYPGIVRMIGDVWPGNPVIDEWLHAYENGTANVPTEEQVDLAIKLKEGHFWTFGNEPLPDDWSRTGFNPSSLAPFFHQLWTALGLNPPPLAPDPAPETDPVQQQPLLGDATLVSISEGGEGQQNDPSIGVQQKVDPNNVLASSVTGGPSNVPGEFDNLPETMVLDVGTPTVTPTSLPNGLSIADGLLAGPAEPAETSTGSTGKADSGTHGLGDNGNAGTESDIGNDPNGGSNNSSNGGSESGSPRDAKQGETGPRHAKADNDKDSSDDGNAGTESGSPRDAKQDETGPRHAKADNDNDNDNSGGGGQHRADAA